MLPPRVLVPLVLSAVLCGAALPRDYGEVVMAAGWDGSSVMSSVETMGGPNLPDLPESVSGNTLTLIGPVLYSCVLQSCYTLNTSSTDPQWLETVSLPERMYLHTAVAVGSHIWFMQDSTVYDLDTASNEIFTYQTPFQFEAAHCAVSNDGHSFVLGVGQGKNEIWLNSVSYSPEQWEYVGNLTITRVNFGCLWFSNYIISTGGYPNYDSTEVFDLNTGTSQVTGDLVTEREELQMFVLDRKPAVVGGDNLTDCLSSIETYDFRTGTWTTSSQRLVRARTEFSLAQFIH